MRSNGFSCDVCPEMRREANHWFMAEVRRSSAGKKVIIFPWDKFQEPDERLKHLCGIECATKFLARELSQEFPRIQ